MDVMLERIIALIGEKHGSTKELADYLGISPNKITDWKAGRIKSYRKYLPQIADYYNVSLDWLSGNSEEMNKPEPPKGYEFSDIDIQLLKKLPNMTTNEKIMLFALIETYQKTKEESV